MKQIIPTALLGALLAVGAATAATTTPVGYYQFPGLAGGNLFVPGFVNSPAFAGAITGSTATTLTVAANSLTANAFNAGSFATHYAEITSGPNAGTTVDIASNTASVITLSSSVASLGLTGSETIVVRPHVTLKGSLSGGEASFAAFSDTATFYPPSGGIITYFYDGAGNWTSDFVNPDGNTRPIVAGTGFVLGLTGNLSFSVTGEVKSGPTVVQLKGGVVNIVGPINPLVGDGVKISDLGFENMLPFTDSLTTYSLGALSITGTYFADGAGDVTVDFVNPSNDTFANTTGGVLTASGDTALKLASGL